MTAVETQNSDGMLRPTDLSLKGCLNTKYKEFKQSPLTPTDQQQLYDKSFPYTADFRHHWRNAVVSESTALPFSLALASSENHLPLDPMAKLVVLESLFSHHKNYSQPAVLEHATGANGGLRSHNSSDNSNEKFAISQPMIEAAKGLTELKQSGTFNSRTGTFSHQTTNNETISNSIINKSKPCKRKGGWKFHDFSDESDGPGKRKRMYCHNRLENEITQMYQDRVTIREVSAANTSIKPTERLVVIEPTYISNSDLIRFNTSLRIILDKKKGIYRLQVLPHTIEQGPLSNKQKVLTAVSRMLGENGAVLCPGITQIRIPSMSDTENYWMSNEEKKPKKNWLGFTPSTSGSLSETEIGCDTKYRGRWKILDNYTGNVKRSVTPPDNASHSSTVSPTDKLLMTLNKELSATQRPTNSSLLKQKEQVSTTDCLIWHVPPPSVKNKKTWPEEAKWCQNCLKKMRVSLNSVKYPRTSST